MIFCSASTHFGSCSVYHEKIKYNWGMNSKIHWRVKVLFVDQLYFLHHMVNKINIDNRKPWSGVSTLRNWAGINCFNEQVGQRCEQYLIKVLQPVLWISLIFSGHIQFSLHTASASSTSFSPGKNCDSAEAMLQCWSNMHRVVHRKERLSGPSCQMMSESQADTETCCAQYRRRWMFLIYMQKECMLCLMGKNTTTSAAGISKAVGEPQGRCIVCWFIWCYDT